MCLGFGSSLGFGPPPLAGGVSPASYGEPRRSLGEGGIWESGVEKVAAHDPISTKVTWSREISRIVQRRCVSCHLPDGFASFSLATYKDARPWAVAIKEEALAGLMPPWGADAGVGQFANDRRLSRHELELIASWVDGGAPAGSNEPFIDAPVHGDGLVVPLANEVVTEETERAASVTLQLSGHLALTAWTFEPGDRAVVERADLEIGSRWLGAWTPGDARLPFPAGAGVPLGESVTLNARIWYRAPKDRTVDYSRLRLWMAPAAGLRSVRETTVVRSWRAAASSEIFALRPSRDDRGAEAVARFADGHVEALGSFTARELYPHPTYRLATPLAMPAGARIETTAPVRILYVADATRTVNRNVRRRPRR
jgi:hypothetical protein